MDPSSLGKILAFWIVVLCLCAAFAGAVIASLAWALLT
jgi:hypothetical protein